MKFCERPFNYVYIVPSGEIWPCAWLHYAIGNIYNQNFDEAWHSKEADEARESILNGSFAYCRKLSCPYCEQDTLPDLSAEEFAKQAIPNESPESISIAIDKTCNIACTTCRTSMFCADDIYRKNVDEALVKMTPILNRAKKVYMNGQGEFLANPSFIRLLERLKPEREDFSINFETNGILFNEAHWKHFEHLSKYDMGATVTVNSLRREVYRYLTGGFDKLDTLLANLKFMSQLRREGKLNHLCVTMVVQESNFWEIPEYVKTFADSDGEFCVDRIQLKNAYKWFGMTEDTYWFKNILNPQHPYHQEYLKILADDCWKNPKVYDWGCHNVRESLPYPLTQEKQYNEILLAIYENEQGLSAVDFIKEKMRVYEGKRIAIFGDNEMSKAMVRLLKKAGMNIALEWTWFKDEDGEIPKVCKQSFKPDMADVFLMLDFYDRQNITNNLRNLGFEGPVVTMEEVVKGKLS